MLTRELIDELERDLALIQTVLPEGHRLLVANLAEPDEALAHFETCFLLAWAPDEPAISVKPVKEIFFTAYDMEKPKEIARALLVWLASPDAESGRLSNRLTRTLRDGREAFKAVNPPPQYLVYAPDGVFFAPLFQAAP